MLVLGSLRGTSLMKMRWTSTNQLSYRHPIARLQYLLIISKMSMEMRLHRMQVEAMPLLLYLEDGRHHSSLG